MKLAAVVLWRGGVPAVVVPEPVAMASLVVVAVLPEDAGNMVVFPSVHSPVVHAPPVGCGNT